MKEKLLFLILNLFLLANLACNTTDNTNNIFHQQNVNPERKENPPIPTPAEIISIDELLKLKSIELKDYNERLVTITGIAIEEITKNQLTLKKKSLERKREKIFCYGNFENYLNLREDLNKLFKQNELIGVEITGNIVESDIKNNLLRISLNPCRLSKLGN